MAEDKYKDACKYGVEVVKQFNTFIAAGIAFVIGIILSDPTSNFKTNVAAIILLITSMILGLIFIMSVVAHININNNYNIYTWGLRIISIAQIVFFISAIVVVGICALRKSKNLSKENNSCLYIKNDDREIQYPISPNDIIKLRIEEIELDVSPSVSLLKHMVYNPTIY